LRTSAGRPTEIKGEGRTKITCYLSTQQAKEFDDLCNQERVATSEKLRSMIAEELEKKNSISSPIGVAYGSRQTNLLEFNDSIDIEELKKASNYLYWEDKAKAMSCQERLETGEFLGSMMSEAFKNRRHFLKTGTYRSRLNQQGQTVFRIRSMGWD
jgi:hypothetical protein